MINTYIIGASVHVVPRTVITRLGSTERTRVSHVDTRKRNSGVKYTLSYNTT